MRGAQTWHKPLPPSPTSSAPRSKPKGRAAPARSGIVNPKTYKGGKRPQKAIEPVVLEKPRGTAGPDRQALSVRLQEEMAFGREVAAKRAELRAKAARGELQPRQPKVAAAAAEIEYEEDDFMMLAKEVEEQRDYLERMERLGRGREVRAECELQISQKIRLMERISTQRDRQLAALEAQQ